MTTIQKRIYNKLLKGATIHTSSDCYGATISGVGADLEISSKEFMRLLDMKMIYQELGSPFYYYFDKTFNPNKL